MLFILQQWVAILKPEVHLVFTTISCQTLHITQRGYVRYHAIAQHTRRFL